MDLREWLKDVKLKFKKGNKLVSEPKEPLFKKWILEEIKYRYNIGSMRKNNVYLDIDEYNNLDEETIITENWGLDRIAQYFCDEWNRLHPLKNDMKFRSTHQWSKDHNNNYIYIESTDIIIYMEPSNFKYSEIVPFDYNNLYIRIESEKLNTRIEDKVDETKTKYIFNALEKMIKCYNLLNR